MITFSNDHSETRAILAWAKSTVVASGLDNPLLSAPNTTFSESDLLGELAWVVLCSGFKESVVRRIFGKISLCFFDWVSAAKITQHATLCVATALDVFRSKPKIAAIVHSAALIEANGFKSVRRDIITNPIHSLQMFPFIAEITAFHLAKNLGFDVSKPDRHLQRLSARHGYSNVQDFCSTLARVSGESIRNIDTLLWRISEMGLASEMRFASIMISPDQRQAHST
jgi:N-glycosylase/DNA lyase